jgi:hypothetical protein
MNVIALSEAAKQSSYDAQSYGDCFAASRHAMTAESFKHHARTA